MADDRWTSRPLPTAVVADACLRLNVALQVAPTGLVPVLSGSHIGGRALPVRHSGSVDVFFEAFEQADPGDVLVIDNSARMDEGCIGDLVVIEAMDAGLAGIVVWGCHRDHAEVGELGLPVFSYGRLPNGPLAARDRPPDAIGAANFGAALITRSDLVVADDDGAVFFPSAAAADVFDAGEMIRTKERTQADAVRAGENLRAQMRFREFLEKRAADPGYTFREHLRQVGAEVEE